MSSEISGMATRGLTTKLLAVACLATASAEKPEQAEDGSEASITAEEILANPLAEDAYEQSSRCLSTAKYRRVDIMNNQVLIFHGRATKCGSTSSPTVAWAFSPT